MLRFSRSNVPWLAVFLLGFLLSLTGVLWARYNFEIHFGLFQFMEPERHLTEMRYWAHIHLTHLTEMRYWAHIHLTYSIICYVSVAGLIFTLIQAFKSKKNLPN